jgi:hypothetical protein
MFQDPTLNANNVVPTLKVHATTTDVQKLKTEDITTCTNIIQPPTILLLIPVHE